MNRAYHPTAKTSAQRPVEKRLKPRPLALSLSRFKSTAAICAALVASTGSNNAGNTWTGNGATGAWSDDANWGGAQPTLGTLTFATGGPIGNTSILDQNYTMNMLLWTGAEGWTINNSGGFGLSLVDSGGVQAKIDNQSTGTVNLNLPIDFAATAGPNYAEISATSGDINFGGAGSLSVTGSGVNGVRLSGTGHTTTFNGAVNATGKYFATTGATTMAVGGAFTSTDLYLMNGGTLKLNSGGSLTVANGLTLGGDGGVTGTQNLALGATFQLTAASGGQSLSNNLTTASGNTSGALLVDSLNTSGTNTFSGNLPLASNLIFRQASGGSSTITGVISGAGGFAKEGGGTVNLQGANTTTGALAARGGVLSLNGAGAATAATSVAISNRGTLTLDNSGTNSGNRINNTAAFTSSTGGGTINFIGNAAATLETLGAVTLSSGALTINSTSGGGGNTLTLTSLARTTGNAGTLYANGTGLGVAGNQVIMTTASTMANNIVPWAFVNDGTSVRFATHSGNNTSLRPKLDGYTTAEGSWGANTVLAASTAGVDVTLSGNRTVFSLTLDNGSDILTPTVDRTLTIGGTGLVGSVLQTGGTSTIAGDLVSGFENVLAFGANEALFYTVGTLAIQRGNGTGLTGTAGLTKSGAGTLIIATPSGITGNYRINEGILEARRADSLNATAQNVMLNGGTLRLANDVGFTLTGNLNVTADSTIEVARTSAGNTVSHAVGTLNILGGRKLSVNQNLHSADQGYRLTTGAVTINAGGATFDVANNGLGIGTVALGAITNATTAPILKLGAGDLVTTSTTTGFVGPVEIQAGRVGWTGTSGTVAENVVLSGAGGIVKGGAGAVTLGGANTFTGGITMNTNSGRLRFSTVGNNGTTVASNLGMGTDGITINGILDFIGGTNQSTNRAITLAASSTFEANGAGTITYAGPITAAGNTLTLTGLGSGAITGSISQTGTSADVNINNGWTWAPGAASTVADDIVASVAATLNLNSPGVLSFSNSPDATISARSGAVINLGADDATGTSVGLDVLAIGNAGTAATSVLNMGTFNLTTPQLALGTAAAGVQGYVSGTGTLTVGNVINLAAGTVAANLAGAGAISKTGPSSVILSGDNSGLTGTAAVRLDAGSLLLNYTASNTAKLVATTGLDMRGGTLVLNGNAGADTTQTVANVTLNTGASRIELNSGGAQSVVLNLGGITRSSVGSGTLRFALPASGGITSTVANNNALSTGIIGGWATLTDASGNTFFARNDGANNIVASNVTSQDNVTLWAAGDNLTDSSGYTGTILECASINSLRFNAAGPSTVNLAPGGILGINTGGILVTSNVTAGAPSILGGRLVSTAADIIITQDSAAQPLTISSTITGNSAVTKAGVGSVILSGVNDYTGVTQIHAGTLVASGGSAIGDTSVVGLSDDQASTFQITSNETIGKLSGGNATVDFLRGTVDIGSNILTMNHNGAATTYAGVITGSGGLVKNGVSNLNLTGASGSGFTGTVTIGGGMLQLSGLGSMDATAFTVNKAAFMIDKNGTTRTATAILDTASVTLNSADGASFGTTVPRGLWLRNDQANTFGESVGALNLNSGANYSAMEATAGGAVSTLAVTNVVRSNGATLDIRGTNMGATAGTRAQLRIGDNTNRDAFMAANLIGGGITATGSKNISIIPWAIGEHVTGSLVDANMGNSLVTYTTNGGFRALDIATEYDTYTAASTATENIRENLVANLTGLTGKTINSLVLHNSNTTTTPTSYSVTGAGAQTLVLTSGALLFTHGGSAANNITLGGFDNGITTAGANPEYVIHVVNTTSAAATNLTATISSPLTTAADITKAGRGILILSANNTAGGGAKKTTINEGTLQIDDLERIGGNSGNLVFGGGTLQMNSGGFADDLSDRTIIFLPGGGTIDTNGNNSLMGNGLGSGTGTFTKAGAGRLTLGAATSLTGGTTINAGTVAMGANLAIGSGDLTIAAGAALEMNAFNATVGNITLPNSASNALVGTGTLTGSGTLTANQATISPVLAGTMNLLKQTAATTLTLSNANNSYTGYTHIQDGTVAVAVVADTSTVSPLGAPTTVENGAIRLGNLATTGALRYTGATGSTNRQIWLVGTTGGGIIKADGTGPLTVGSIRSMEAGTKALTLQGTGGSTAAPNLVNGTIDQCFGILSLTKSEAGVWSIPNASTYTGGTTIGGGTLMIGNDGSLGSGTVTFTGGVLDNSGGNRSLANNLVMSGTGTLQGAGNFTFSGNTSQTGGNRSLIVNNVGTTTIGDTNADTLTLAELDQARTLILNVSPTSAVVINATVVPGAGTGNDGLAKVGAGSLTLNAANTYTGQTTLANGTLTLGNDSALGVNDLNVTGTSTVQGAGGPRSLPNNINVGSAAGAVNLTFGGTSDLAFTGNITSTAANNTFTVTNTGLTTFGDSAADTFGLADGSNRNITIATGAGASLTINSTIQNGGAGSGSLTKTGPGTLTLTAVNIYTGATALQDGLTVAVGGANDRLPTGTALTMGTSTTAAKLQLGNGAGASDQTITSLSSVSTGSAIVGGNAAFSTLTVNQSGNTTYSGKLGGAGANENNLNLVKSNSGDLILNGTNTYTGTTNVSAGKIYIDTPGSLASTTTSLTVADGAEFHIRGTNPVADVIYTFSGPGNVITVGGGSGTSVLGFGLDGGFNTRLALGAGQTMSVGGTSTVATAITVVNAPNAGQDYILIDGADFNSLHAGSGTFDVNPVVFNGGSFTYALRFDSGINGGGLDQWILTPTAQAAANDVWWKGDLTGLGTGVWSASTTSGAGFPTNWDDSQTGGIDALVPPDSGSIVHFSADGAANFATTLGANLRIQELIFHSSTATSSVSVGGANTLTLGNGTDPSGLTIEAGGPNVTFTSNVRLGQAQSWNISSAATSLTLSGSLTGTGALNINDNGSSVGTLVLTGSGGLASYSGATNLAAGRLVLNGGANNRLPTTTALTMGTSTSGATLQLGDSINGISNNLIGSLNSGTNTSNSIVGGGTAASTLTIDQTSAGTFRGVIGGAGTNENQVAIVKRGSATLTLNGANTYVGTTTVNDGILRLGSTGSIAGSTGLIVNANAGVTASFDVNGRTAVLAGPVTLGGANATSQANIDDTATGGLLTLGGNVTYDATNNPLGSTISVNLASGTGTRTFTANDSSNASVDLLLAGTYASTSSGILDGTGVGTINGAWTLTGTDLALTKNGTGTWNINATTNTTGSGDWNINAGTTNATVSNALNAADNLIIDGTGVQDSAIVNVSGSAGSLGIHQGNGLYVRNGGRLNVSVNNGVSTGTNFLNIGDTTSTGAAGAGRVDLAANISIATGIQLGASGNQIGIITGTGTITSPAGTYSLRGGTIASGITLAGVAGITKVGDGSVLFSGNRTASGATAIQEGALVLDYTTNNLSKIGAAMTLSVVSSTQAPASLTINGNDTAPTSDSLTGTTILAGDSPIAINNGSGQTATLALGSLTRTTLGGTVPFEYFSASAGATTTSANASALGWATVTTGGTTRFAAINGGNIVQATTTAQNDVSQWHGNQNIITTGALTGTAGGCALISSLTFDAADAATANIGTNNILYITSGGILVNPSVGANSSVIQGGSLVSTLATGSTIGELIVHQNNTAGTLTIASNILNSPGITKSGAGILILSGDNTFQGTSRISLNEGTLQASGGAAIGDSTLVFMRTGTTLDVGGSSEAIGNLGEGVNSAAGNINISTGGNLTINQTTASGLLGTITGGGTFTKAGTANFVLAGNSSASFTGPLVVNGGVLTLSGANGRVGSTTITISGPGSELINEQDQAANVDRLVGSVTLNNTGGGNGLFLRTNQAATRTETIGGITLGAGHNVITAHGNATGGIADLSATTLTRTGRATALVRGNGLGGTGATRSQIRFSTAPTGLVGAGGSTGATNISILPYLIGDLSQAGLGNSFVTNVGTLNGLRPLATSEYVTNDTGFNVLTGSTGQNVRFTATPTLSATPTAINSLVLDNPSLAGAAMTVTGTANPIEITSGGIISAGSAANNLGGFSAITTGGGRDYTVYTSTAANTLTVSSPLTSAVPLVKAGAGTLSLTNAGNAFTDTHINQGFILADDLDKLGTGTINFAGGGLRLAAGWTDDLSTKTLAVGTGDGTIDVSAVTTGGGTTLTNGIDATGGSARSLTFITRSSAVAGQLTVNGASSFTGTTVFNHTSVNSTAANSVVLNGTTNAAINGNLQIGSAGTITGTNDVVVALGASEQIVNTASITFRGALGANAVFKLLGNTETVAGISDNTGNGLIVNRDSEVVSTPGSLILNSSSNFSYNGMLRDAAPSNGADANPLTLTKQGTGIQTLSGAGIRHSGATTISGGTLVLQDVTNWQSAITNNADLTLNQSTTRSHSQAITGSGNVLKMGTGNLTLLGNNSFAGTTTVEQGTLTAGAAGAIGNSSMVTVNVGGTLMLSGADPLNRIGDTVPLTLSGGVFNTAGLDENLGVLTLTCDSVIDMLAGTSILKFADSSGAIWASGARLSIWNWTSATLSPGGDFYIGGGADQLHFGSVAGGLTGAQLAQIDFYTGAGTGLITGFPENGFIGPDGEVTPIPEPSGILVGLAMFGLAGWRERRKSEARRREERQAVHS
jgi:autotransporter-associated beta strand protein